MQKRSSTSYSIGCQPKNKKNCARGADHSFNWPPAKKCKKEAAFRSNANPPKKSCLRKTKGSCAGVPIGRFDPLASQKNAQEVLNGAFDRSASHKQKKEASPECQPICTFDQLASQKKLRRKC